MFTKIFLHMGVFMVLTTSVNEGCGKKITVEGKAIEDKEGALVLVEESGKNFKKGMYFIDGLLEWSDKVYGKKVRATGRLILEKHEEVKGDSVWIQHLVGTKATLKKAKWVLVE
jgi:hypothetical protein